ncbi:MAG: outer membrane protein transport protein [Steroidobacteraceae bacterium]
MKSIDRSVKQLLWMAALGAAGVAPAFGAGFALLEQSASGLGRSFAGSAAVADDATTIFFNAAGLAELNSQAVVGASLVDIDSKFHSDLVSVAAAGQTSVGGDGGNAGGLNTVPSAYLAWRLSPRLVAGLGVNAPYGLKTEYDNGWVGRFQALKSDVKTLNINPTLAWRLSDRWSFGIGADQQHIKATLSSNVNVAAALLNTLTTMYANSQISQGNYLTAAAASYDLTGTSTVTGSDNAWGWNAGALFKATDNTRIGVSYRSAISYHIRGDVNFDLPGSTNPYVAGIIATAGVGQLADGPVSLDLKLPALAIASLTHKLTDRAAVMADVSWTGWSSVPALNIVRDSGTTLSSTPEKWKDTWRYALGADCQVSDSWVLRVGAAYDQSPVPDSTRTPRLPDADRTWLSAGASWKPNQTLVIDAGYAHLIAKDAKLDQDNGSEAAYGLIDGVQKSSIDIFALQAHLNF